MYSTYLDGSISFADNFQLNPFSAFTKLDAPFLDDHHGTRLLLWLILCWIRQWKLVLRRHR